MGSKVRFAARVQVVTPAHPAKVWVHWSRKEEDKVVVRILGHFPILAIAVGGLAEAAVSLEDLDLYAEPEQPWQLYKTFRHHVLGQFDIPIFRPAIYVLIPDHIIGNPWVRLGIGPEELYEQEKYEMTGAFFTRAYLECSLELARELFAKEGIPVEVHEDTR